MMPWTPFSTWIRIGVVLGFVLILLYVMSEVYQAGKQEVQQLWDQDRLSWVTQRVASEKKLREMEADLARQAASLRESTDEKLRVLAAQRDDVARRLRIAEAARSGGQREPGVSGSAADPSAGSLAFGSSVSQLPGSIGEPDVDEAYRADVLRLHLLACYSQYQRVEEALGAGRTAQ